MIPSSDRRATESFLAQVGAPDLRVYLGLDDRSPTEEVQRALEARRVYLQGMFSNPKYRDEARALLSNFESLARSAAVDAIPDDPPWTRPSDASSSSEDPITDYYEVLGIAPESKSQALEQAWQSRRADALAHEDAERIRRLDKAWKVLRDPAIRRNYELARRQRPRKSDPGENVPRSRPSVPAPTPAPQPTPPEPLVPAVLGPTEHLIDLDGEPVTLSIRVRVSGPVDGVCHLALDRGWLSVSPHRIDGRSSVHRIDVRIDPRLVPKTGDEGRLRFETGTETPSEIVIRVRHRVETRDVPPLVALGVGLLLGCALTLIATRPDTTLGVVVEPPAASIRVDGEDLGSVSPARWSLSPGLHRVEVAHPGFFSYVTDVVVEQGQDVRLTIPLQLEHPLDFIPQASQQRGTLSREAIEDALFGNAPNLDSCILRHIGGETRSGTVRIYVNPGGTPIGMEVQADGDVPEVLKACLARYVAPLSFATFADGDYAAVHYEFEVHQAVP